MQAGRRGAPPIVGHARAMEQPRPLRRRRRSSRRGAGPPAGPAASALTDTPAAADPPGAAPTSVAATAEVSTAGVSTAGVSTADRVTGGVGSGEPRPEDSAGDGISSPATPVDATNPQNEPPATTAVANATFAAPAELDDPLAGISAPGGLPHAFAGSPGAAAATGPGHPPDHGRPAGEGPGRIYRTPREDHSERSLRALVTTRSTQVSPSAAMRAREAAMPTAADLLAAEADLVVVRRHYVPPTALAAGRRRDRSERRPSGSGQVSAGQTGNAPSAGGQPTDQQPS